MIWPLSGFVWCVPTPKQTLKKTTNLPILHIIKLLLLCFSVVTAFWCGAGIFPIYIQPWYHLKTLCAIFLRHFLEFFYGGLPYYLLRARQAHAIIFLYTILPCMCKQPYKYTNPHYIYYVAYSRTSDITAGWPKKRAHSSVPIIPSKLLQLDDRPLGSPNSFEGIIGTEIYTFFMACLL